MSDDAFVAGLQAIFDADDPADGIDRHDGFGADLRVVSLARVHDGDFPELEVVFELDLPRRLRFRKVARTGTTRVLFGEEWLVASGNDSPPAYAPVVAREVSLAAVNHVSDVIDRPRGRPVDLDEVKRSVPAASVLWEKLVADLRPDHQSVVELEDGVVELVAEWMEGDGTTWVHVTPSQWRELVVDSEVAARMDSGIDASSTGDGPGLAWFHLHEEIGSLADDERHVVFFRGGFHRSVRAELPPVPGRGLDLPPAGGGQGWFAFGPDAGDR